MATRTPARQESSTLVSDHDTLVAMLERAEIPAHEYHVGSGKTVVVDTGTSYNPTFMFTPQGALTKVRVA